MFTANGVMCLVARMVPAVGNFLAHPSVYSWEGGIAGLCSVIAYCLLMHFRENKRIRIFLMLLEAILTSLLVSLFNGTVFGNTLLISSVELSVMMISLSIYTYFASRVGHGFTYIQPFLVSTIPAVAVLVILQIVLPVDMQTWLFAVCAGIFLNMSLLRKSNKLIGLHKDGEGVTEAIILYGYIVRRFLGHISFLLFDAPK